MVYLIEARERPKSMAPPRSMQSSTAAPTKHDRAPLTALVRLLDALSAASVQLRCRYQCSFDLCIPACGQVREALLTSALLQLPYSMPKRDKMDRVEGIIAELVRRCW